MKNIKNSILLISPYLHILGGGEQHICSILKVFDDAGYKSDIVTKDRDFIGKLEKTHNISLKNARAIGEIPRADGYDICLYVTDGSYFFSRAKETYIFYMYPNKEILPRGIINKLKTRKAHFFANGVFTAEKIEKMMKKKVEVVHPFIDDRFFYEGTKKKKIILSVGRFFPHLHSKRQDVLIEAFTKLQKKDSAFRSYKLILAGGLTDAEEDREYYAKLTQMKKENNAIEIQTNISNKELLELYRDAEIYWHAAGFGLNEDRQADGVEHLGITPLQGMAAGAIVFCHNSGGPRRYIHSGENGFLYNSVNELVEQTASLEKKTEEKIREAGIEYVRSNFSKKVFDKKVKDYFHI
jgi:glycosyltransferase involved in cell wall biosynthesis